jgi:hypothetical protein
MKIQEMRSGISHLTKRVETDRRDNLLEIKPAAVPEPEPAPVPPKPQAAACELDEPRWAVVSFDEIEAGGLTYRQAAKLLDELELNGISGLCIVTDAAAQRMPR